MKLQCQLLEKRETEISAVQSKAQSEMKSFAYVVQRSCDTAVAPTRVRQAIGVLSEDRGCNIIMHGMVDDEEEPREDMWLKLELFLREMKVNPTVVLGAERIEKYRKDKTRPIKI